MSLFALLLSLVAIDPVPLPGGSEPDIGAAIRSLGHDDFETREAAEVALVRFGPKAYRQLVDAAAGRDPEIAYRADRILRKHFDAVDFGGGGRGAPMLADAAGPREWVTMSVQRRTEGGGVVQTWATLFVPKAGPIRDLAERYGRRVLAERGETAGPGGSKNQSDPLENHVQQAATVRLFRDLQLAGCRKSVLKAAAKLLDDLSIRDDP